MATQSEINAFVEQIMPYFDPAPVEDDSVQQSFPRLDRGLSDVQDMARFQSLYGIFDNGHYAYRLEPHATESETNQANTMFLMAGRDGKPAEATLRGCFHRLLEPIELSFPAVTVPTVQYAVIEYDPVRSEGGGDPLEAKVVTSLDRSQGKDFLVLHAVDRRPSQLLTEAPIRRFLPRSAGVVYVWDESHKPDPASVLWGTVCVVGSTSQIYRSANESEAGGSGDARAWVSMTDLPWSTYSDTPTYRWPGHGFRRAIQRDGKTRRMRGRIERANGSTFTQNSSGYLLATLDPDDRPPREVRLVTAGSNLASPNLAVINISASTGEVRAHPASTMTWVSLDGVEWYTE